MSITVNLKALESMHYFWVATKAREKVGEHYIKSIADMKEMEPLYSEEFTRESLRKLLSGISNREMFGWNKTEGRFWNNNMWIFEEWDLMENIVSRVKVLNLSELSGSTDSLEVVIIPGHIEASYFNGSKLTINYFKLRVEDETNELLVEGQPIREYILENIKC